jgi:FkbM family methyltransferase
MEQGQFEPNETGLIRELVQSVDVVINVGANIGYYSCLALQAGKSLVAFEPIPENLHFLLRNIKANGWESRAEVFPMALSNHTGILEIYGGGTGASLIEGWAQNSSDDVTLVPITTLDKVLGSKFNHNEKILFIVDIEGAEKMMLDGASGFINRSPKPLWVIEVTSHQHQPAGVVVNPHLLETFRLFWNTGYEAWAVEDSLRKVSPQEIEDLIQFPGKKMGAPNYLFREAS